MAFVLRREQAERDLLAAGGGDLGALRLALDDELVADAVPASTDRARLLAAVLAELQSA